MASPFPDLDFAALEKLVLLTPRALGALQATNQKERHPYRDQEGQQIGIRRKPVSQFTHKLPVETNAAHSKSHKTWVKTDVQPLESC